MNPGPVPPDEFVVIQPGGGNPELSVLMPLYEQERFVAEAVRSVLAQDDVIAEIIVSDDASLDSTFTRAIEALDDAPRQHRIVTRRGTRRLRRDHVAALVDQASCDIVMLAHGDDRSRPTRARTVLEIFGQQDAVLVGSEAITIDEHGRVVGQPPSRTSPIRQYSPTEVVDWSSLVFSGSRLAWRRDRLAGFVRLDSSAAGSGHDVVLTFRAALAGPVFAATTPLVEWRDHAATWSRAIADWRSADAGTVGMAMYWLSALRAMRRDVETAGALRFLDEPTGASLRATLDQAVATREDSLLAAHDQLVSRGQVPLWVDDSELRRAWQGGPEIAFGVIQQALAGREPSPRRRRLRFSRGTR